ncbi:NAD(P)-dependent oxidoreductase [Actinocorallia sp. B10E7]|uniref:NAD(P)-dependent oxidoreductase n=1 Tax=Actinocorallia sp. B10E7 TaxID=3153558 RepID=UPI00325F23E7
MIGFVGLGQMGAPMAGHLVERGVIVHDVRPEAVRELVDKGAKAARTLEDLAEAGLVELMVRDDAQVREVCAVLLPLLSPGSVIAIHSTIRAGTAVDLAAEAEPHGVEIVDAPVSGSFLGAHQGTLAAMVGGSEQAFARCQEAFSPWAGLVVHMGPVGAGTHAKLARNLLHFVAFTAAGEAQRLAEAAGVSLRRLARVVRHSDAITGGPGSIMLRSETGPLSPDDPLHDVYAHVLALGDKDLALALELAGELGVETPLTALAADLLPESLGVPRERQA